MSSTELWLTAGMIVVLVATLAFLSGAKATAVARRR